MTKGKTQDTAKDGARAGAEAGARASVEGATMGVAASARARLGSAVGAVGLAALCAGGPLAGCTGPPLKPVVVERGPDAEVTVDGLHRARGTRYANLWVKPDANFASYDQVMIDEIEVAYRRKPKGTRYSRTGSNFALTEKQTQRFKDEFRGIFAEELGNNEVYRVVEEGGPQVLRISAAIIDLIVKVPTDNRASSDRVFTSSTAQMTLLMELRDSLSGEILARVADRREARQPGSGGASNLYYSTAVSDVAAIRRVFRDWAGMLRERLEFVHELNTRTTLEGVD